jgi:hypothetical protein
VSQTRTRHTFNVPLVDPPDFAVTIPFRGSDLRVPVPKDRRANIAWRRELLRTAEADPARRASIVALCSTRSPESFIYWLNAFGRTWRERYVGDDGQRVAVTGEGASIPVITWPCQDRAARLLINAIEGSKDVVGDKARDMGLSWLCVWVFTWYFLFHPDTQLAMMSRVEQLVDDPGNPDSLFWKMDFTLRNLPWWMLPPMDRRKLHIRRLDAVGNIVGLSTTGAQGRAGRRRAYLIDEAAFVDCLKPIWTSLGQSTSSRIAISTANGPVYFSTLVRSDKFVQIKMPWWDHPEKGKGRRVVWDEATKRMKVTSPWRESENLRAMSFEESAQEIDGDHMAGGRVFFPNTDLDRHEAMSILPAPYRGQLVYRGPALKDDAIREHRWECWDLADAYDGPLRVWPALLNYGEREDSDGPWRPDQLRTYVMGIDISHGTGSANSVACVVDADSGEQVAELASASLSPDEFARVCCGLGLWFGGPNGSAFMVWEANGPGGMFGKMVRELGYPWVYYQIDESRRSPKRSDHWGWHSSKQNKQDLLGLWRAALARGEFTPRSEKLVGEARQYVFYPSGSVGPAELTDEGGDARATHGDRVIAAALAHYGRAYAPRCSPPEREPPAGSVAARLRQRGIAIV